MPEVLALPDRDQTETQHARERGAARIFHLLDEAETFSERSGGAISRWAANVLRDGDEIVICPGTDGSWDFDASRVKVLSNWRHTDPIHPVLYRIPWTLQKVAYLRAFRELLEFLQPGDLVYVHNRPECASVLATVAGERGFQVVLHMHNSHLTRANKGQLAALKNVPIVFCSEFLRKEIHAALPNHFANTHIVYNGADDRKFRPEPRSSDGTPNVIFTGRLVAYKGVHILMEAMRILQGRGVAARCQVVGSSGFGGNRDTRYVRKLKRMCPANTEMTGYKAGPEVAELLRKADVFCCPSIWNDPFPLAPLEAMATGLPVVASNTGGLPETLAHGGGIMVPAQEPYALADALEKLVTDAEYRSALSREASEAFREHFLWQHVRTQYEAAIEKIRAV